MFEEIIAALDGSPQAARALECALEIAKADSARITICSVGDPRSIIWRTPMAPVAECVLLAAREEAERIVNEAADRAHAKGVSVKTRVLIGNPARAIVDYAGRNHADAILMGTHGRSGLSRALVGSVAEAVLRHAPCPVIVVRGEAQTTQVEAAS